MQNSPKAVENARKLPDCANFTLISRKVTKRLREILKFTSGYWHLKHRLTMLENRRFISRHCTVIVAKFSKEHLCLNSVCSCSFDFRVCSRWLLFR